MILDSALLAIWGHCKTFFLPLTYRHLLSLSLSLSLSLFPFREFIWPHLECFWCTIKWLTKWSDSGTVKTCLKLSTPHSLSDEKEEKERKRELHVAGDFAVEVKKIQCEVFFNEKWILEFTWMFSMSLGVFSTLLFSPLTHCNCFGLAAVCLNCQKMFFEEVLSLSLSLSFYRKQFSIAILFSSFRWLKPMIQVWVCVHPFSLHTVHLV